MKAIALEKVFPHPDGIAQGQESMRNRNVIVGLSLLGAFGTLQTQAVSFRLPNQDPTGIARGNAFAATADNPSAIYYNPAGITQLEGHNISAGVYLISVSTEFTRTSDGARAETDTDFQPVPQIHYVFSPKDSKFSFGLGVYAPYGLSVDYGDNNPFAPMAQNGKVLYATVNPVAAWQITPTLSLAAGPTFNYSEAELENAPAGPGSKFHFEGDGFAPGFNAGLLWKPHAKWSFGVNYRYTTEVDYEGHTDWTGLPFPSGASTSGSLTFPQFVVAGVSFRPNEKWNIEFDIDWTDWDNVNSVVFSGATSGIIPDPAFVLNHESSFMYEFGVTRQLPKNYFISAGFIYSENSIPEATFNPIIPDDDLYLGSLGVGYKGERWSWAVGYHFAWNGEGGSVITGTPGGMADGRYKTLNHAVNVSVGCKF